MERMALDPVVAGSIAACGSICTQKKITIDFAIGVSTTVALLLDACSMRIEICI